MGREGKSVYKGAEIGLYVGILGKSGKKGIKKCGSCRPALEKYRPLWYNNKKAALCNGNAKKKTVNAMKNNLTDMHTHSKFSHDGVSALQDMAAAALEKGLLFYGMSEHFDYDIEVDGNWPMQSRESEAEYFHTARHIQDDYAGCLNVVVGAEFAYTNTPKGQAMYQETYEKYRPDYVINSLHAPLGSGVDYCMKKAFYKDGETRDKTEVYREYLRFVLTSLDAPYPYDIVGHIGYITRYAHYEDRALRLADFQAEIDEVLLAIIKKDKILEVNSSNKGGVSLTLPSEEIVRRYYELGGRKVSFGSDAHGVDRLADKREAVAEMLKNIGFTYVTVPCRGEHIKVEL